MAAVVLGGDGKCSVYVQEKTGVSKSYVSSGKVNAGKVKYPFLAFSLSVRDNNK